MFTRTEIEKRPLSLRFFLPLWSAAKYALQWSSNWPVRRTIWSRLHSFLIFLLPWVYPPSPPPHPSPPAVYFLAISTPCSLLHFRGRTGMANEASRKLMALVSVRRIILHRFQIPRRSLHFLSSPANTVWTGPREKDALKEEEEKKTISSDRSAVRENIAMHHLHATSSSPPWEINDESNFRMTERLIIFHSWLNRSNRLIERA